MRGSKKSDKIGQPCFKDPQHPTSQRRVAGQKILGARTAASDEGASFFVQF